MPVAYVGCQIEELDTPALLVDLDTMDRNINRIASFLKDAGVSWRPHVKGIKVPAIAHQLIAAGAIGVTSAKVSEAECMADSGLTSILIANEIVGQVKLTRLVALAKRAEVICTVDDVANVLQLAKLASDSGIEISLVIEVDVGLNRAGVLPGEPTVALARTIRATPGVRFRGLMAWEGHALAISDAAQRAAAIDDSIERLTSSALACRDAGLPCEMVSCGGTGTYLVTARKNGVTEVQAGGGVFGDVYYRQLNAGTECALTVLATVTSRPNARRIVTDAGKKAMSNDEAAPYPLGLQGVTRVRSSAEHSIIETAVPLEEPRVGDKLTFVVGYGDTTVFLHDYIYGTRNGIVEAIWPVLGRGKIQ